MYIDFTHQNGHQGLNSQNVSYYNVDLVLFQPHDEPLFHLSVIRFQEAISKAVLKTGKCK